MHSDCGKEFENSIMDEMQKRYAMFRTYSAPYDPQANGRAERAVQSLKIDGLRQLVHAGLSPPCWYHAMSQAAFMSRQRSLDIALPKDAPQMGQLVAIKCHDHEAFEPRTLQGVTISYDDDCVHGAYVLTRHKDSLKLHRARMPVLLNHWLCYSVFFKVVLPLPFFH